MGFEPTTFCMASSFPLRAEFQRVPSAISTTGADRCWFATAREGADARSAWTSGAGSRCGRG
jgi:hypothetical protein